MAELQRRLKRYYFYRNPTPSTCEVLIDDPYGWRLIEATDEHELRTYRDIRATKSRARFENCQYDEIGGYEKRLQDVLAYKKWFEVE